MKKLFTLAFFYLLLNNALIGQNPSPCFNGPTSNTLAVTMDAEAICTGDFNNDGKIDLATANTHSDNLSVFLGNGSGNFSPAITFSVGASGSTPGSGSTYGPVSIISADINGDNNADLITTNFFKNDISILVGNGAGGFSTTVDYTVGTNPRSVILEDFNNDLKPDLAVVNMSSNNVSILLGNGGGTFLPATTTLTVGNLPYSIVSADFDGDNKLDLATMNSNSNNISVALGNGNGSFSTAVNYSVSTGYWSNIICKDVTGDGKLDLSTVNPNTYKIYVLNGNGNGTFVTGNTISTGANPNSILCDDFNNDGLLDFATANNTSYDVSVLLGDGSGNFSAPKSFPFLNVSFYRTSSVSGDFNADGRVDIAVNDGNAITILLNKTAHLTALGSGTICQGQNVIIKGKKDTGVTYSWNPGGSTNDSLVATASGVYDYSVTVLDNSCVSISNSFTVTVNPLPIPVAVSNNPCETQQTLNLNCAVSPVGTYTYSWSGPNSFTSAIKNPTINAANVSGSTAGVYTISVTDINNCSNTSTVSVIVNPLPTVTATGDTVCVGQSINLGANGGQNYSWSGPNAFSSTSQNPVILNSTMSMNGSYAVTVTDANGCINSTNAQVVVNICAGVSKLNSNGDNIKIWPNPTSGTFSIETGGLSEQLIQLFDVNGNIVLSQSMIGKSSFNLTGLSKGVYIIRIKDKGNVTNKRLVVTND